MSAGRSDEDLGSIDAPRHSGALAPLGRCKGLGRPAKQAERQEAGIKRVLSLQNRTDKTRDSLVTDLTTDLALSNLCFGRRGVKKQGVLGPKTGASFPLLVLSVVRKR